MSNEAVSISTSKYITTVKAKIDGRIYIVRKIGAGEQLDLSREATKLQEFQVESANLRAKYEVAKTKEEKQKLEAEFAKYANTIGEIADRIEAVYVGLFDDGEDGRYSKKLVHTLGINNIREVYEEIMGVLDEKSA